MFELREQGNYQPGSITLSRFDQKIWIFGSPDINIFVKVWIIGYNPPNHGET
jgi:hypothetical protein